MGVRRIWGHSGRQQAVCCRESIEKSQAICIFPLLVPSTSTRIPGPHDLCWIVERSGWLCHYPYLSLPIEGHTSMHKQEMVSQDQKKKCRDNMGQVPACTVQQFSQLATMCKHEIKPLVCSSTCMSQLIVFLLIRLCVRMIFPTLYPLHIVITLSSYPPFGMDGDNITSWFSHRSWLRRILVFKCCYVNALWTCFCKKYTFSSFMHIFWYM